MDNSITGKEKDVSINNVSSTSSRRSSRRVSKIREKSTILKTLRNFKDLLVERKILSLLPYMIQSGLFQGYALGTIYRLVVQVYKGSGQTEAFVKRVICIVQISYAIASYVTSKYSKGQSVTVRYYCIKGSSLILTGFMIAHLLLFDKLHNIYMVLVPSIIFGSINIAFTQYATVYISENYEGKIEAFLIYKQCQNLFCSLFMIAYVALPQVLFLRSHAGIHIFLTVWLVLAFRK